MAWDKTLPQGSTKIRNLGDVITPNWDAIETADSTFLPQALNLADRDALAIASDPTAIADSVILYSKQDAAGNPQAYFIDPSSNVIQMTTGLPIGAATGSSNLPGGIIIKWGPCNANGAGLINTFTTPFPNACWVVIPVGTNTAQPTNVIKPTLLTVNKFTAVSPAGEAGYYIAIGN